MCLNTHRPVTADLTGGDIYVAAKAQIQYKGGQFFIRDPVYGTFKKGGLSYQGKEQNDF